MSILIKGMEMPTRCEDCFCFRRNAEHDYAYCNISSVNVLGHGNARLNNCPLVPVPPHGRLIDADTLEREAQKRLLECEKYDNQFQKPYEVMRAIALAPTIIPASEEGE